MHRIHEKAVKPGELPRPEFEDEIGSLQEENTDPAARQSLWERMFLSEDWKSVKQLLFELSTAHMAFKTVGTNYVHRHQLDEAVLSYDNFAGDVSFNFKRSNACSNNKQTRTFYGGVFKNLRTFFKDEVHFYIALRSKLGLAIKFEYLGSVPTFAPISPSTPHGRMVVSLQSMCRHAVLVSRAVSALQNVARYVLRMSIGDFANEMYLPALVTSLSYEGATPFANPLELDRKWRHLTRDRYWRQFAHRFKGLKLKFFDHFDPALRRNMVGISILQANFLSYQTYDYLDEHFEPKPVSDQIAICHTAYQDDTPRPPIAHGAQGDEDLLFKMKQARLALDIGQTVLE